MGKEFCIKAVAKSGKLPNILAIGTLPPHIHGWFSSDILTVGDRHCEEILSRSDLASLCVRLESWVNQREVTDSPLGEVLEAYTNTQRILLDLSELADSYELVFGNYIREESK